MDTIFAQAVSKIVELPEHTQRVIGKALLDGAEQPELPVIQFTDEELGKIEEGVASIERGDLISQKDAKARFNALRAKSYAAL